MAHQDEKVNRMELPKNQFKAAIKSGKPQIGLWCAINDPTVAELLAGCGYDWLLFDTEHAPMDHLDTLPLLQAVAPYPVTPIVRPTSLDVAEIKKLLDIGAQTLLIPYVQTAEEAELAVKAVAYPPAGIRGVAGITRASRYGTVDNYHLHARDEICLLIQVETKTALDNLDSILAVEGLDGVFIGPADLAASLGYPGQASHPEVRRICVETIKRIRAAGLPAGFLTLDEPVLAEMIEAGSVFTAVGVDNAILQKGARERAKHWKAKAGA
jgi:4-hydroxy-2-oxoheptanedioate aldolase